MFRLIKKVLILVLVSTAISLKCISLKHQECKVRKVIVDNKYIYICNPHSRVCIPDIIKKCYCKNI